MRCFRVLNPIGTWYTWSRSCSLSGRMYIKFWFFILCVSMTLGCGDDDPTVPPDAAPDATADASPDATADASPDATVDASPDATVDASPDATADASPDAMLGDCIDPPAPADRTSAFSCERCRPPGRVLPSGISGMCMSHDDCTDGANGRCTVGRFAFCSYDECFSDADCPADELCACDGGRGGGNACIMAGCHTTADCSGSHACAPSLGSCGNYSPPVGYWCHTDADTCTVDADCPASGMGPGPGYCAYSRELGHWACSYSHCVG